MSDWTRRALSSVLGAWLILLPIAVYSAGIAITNSDLGFDFHVFYTAARGISHGHPVYDPAGIAHAHALATQHPGVPVPRTSWAVYPPVLYELIVPIGYLPWAIADVIGLVGLAALPLLALRVMGVRDWRCYAVAYASVPVYTSVLLGTISGALMLGVALMWRGRHIVSAGSAAFAAKLFLWPLLLVEVGRDRRRGVSLVACAAALVIVPWAFLGFSDLTQYPAMLSDLSGAEAHDSYSATGLAFALGVPPRLGTDIGIALALALTVLAVRVARRGSRDAAYTLAIVAALLASPIVWMHYLMLLFLPLAARYARLNWVWLVALLPWAGPHWGANGHVWAFISTWPCYGVIVLATLFPAIFTRHRVTRARQPNVTHSRAAAI